MVRQWLSGSKLRPPSSRREPNSDAGTGELAPAWLCHSQEARKSGSSSRGVPLIYTVNSTGSGSSGTGTSGTLPYVIGQANMDSNTAGSLIEFDPTVFSSQKTITLSSTLALSETAGPEVIAGPGRVLVTVSGGGAVRVFSIANSATTATLSGLTIANGSTGTDGAGILNSGNLTLSDSSLSGNTAGTTGGGIENDAGTLAITGSLIARTPPRTTAAASRMTAAR